MLENSVIPPNGPLSTSKLAVMLDILANAWLVAVSPMTSALPTMLAITLASVLNISTPCMLK